MKRNKNIIWLPSLCLYLVFSSVFFSCVNKKTELDSKSDAVLRHALNVVKNKGNLNTIPIKELQLNSFQYLQNGERGKACLSNALIGCCHFYSREYYNSIVAFKQAESMLEYCDSVSQFVHFHLAKLLMEKDSLASLEYIGMAIAESKTACDTMWLSDSYLQKAITLNDIESGRLFLDSALMANCDRRDVCKAHFANFYREKMDPDSVIKYVMPLYLKLHYATEAESLTWAYIVKNMPDSANIYLQDVKNRPLFKEAYFRLSAELSTILGDYEKATGYYNEAYKLRLGNERKYVNEKLEVTNTIAGYKAKKEKRKKEMILIVMIVGLFSLVFIIVLTWRLKRHKELIVNNNTKLQHIKHEMEDKNITIAKQQDMLKNKDDIIDNQQIAITDKNEEISCLKEAVSGYENSVRDLEDFCKRHEALVSQLRQQLAKAQDTGTSENAILRNTVSDYVIKYNPENYEKGCDTYIQGIKDKYPELSQSELNVIWMIFLGCTIDEIASLLNISRQTVYNYRSHIATVMNIVQKGGKFERQLVDIMVTLKKNTVPNL